MSVANELHRRDRVCVQEEAFMDVTELHAPHLQVLVSRPGRKQSAIRRDIEGQDRQLVPVQVQKQLHRVNVANLECLVE